MNQGLNPVDVLGENSEYWGEPPAETQLLHFKNDDQCLKFEVFRITEIGQQAGLVLLVISCQLFLRELLPLALQTRLLQMLNTIMLLDLWMFTGMYLSQGISMK